MSDQYDLSPGEGSDDQSTFSIDDETQLTAEDQLEDRGVDDLLDEGYSPPERPRAVESFGITAEEQREGETLDQRLREELPDDPEDQHDPRATPPADDGLVGGDDPDAIAVEDDFLGDPEVGDERAGRLVSPDEGVREDSEKDLVAGDEGFAGGAASAEEAAVHVVESDEA